MKEAKAAGKYDMFVALHKFANNDVYAHSSGGFYPWHRKFLLEFENMLRSLKGGIQVCHYSFLGLGSRE